VDVTAFSVLLVGSRLNGVCRYDSVCMAKASPKKKSPSAATGNGRGSVSIHDVAQAAKVSIATVSRVMNNPALVAPKTAARVQEVIRQVGYVPNPFAQGLMTHASRVLGIALPDIHGEFYSELLRGADAESRSLGYHLLVSSEPRAGEPDPRGLAFGLIDGLAVMITNPDAALVKLARESSLPTVVLDTDLHQRGVDSVVVDNTPGTREAVQHLLASIEPRNLFFVGGPRENFDTQQRARAFGEALGAAGWQAKAEQVAFGEYTPEWGRAWLLGHLGSLRGAGESGVAEKPRATIGIFAGNDEIAIGVMQAADGAGIKVPDQLRVVGFDDTRLAQLVRPRLSSVRVPMADVGAAAVRMLVRRVEDPKAEATCVHMPTKLVVRESSGASV
jgi:LacI family transcriptional regulator